MFWKQVLAAVATGLQYTLASREFQIPETPGELKKQIEIFQNPVFQQQNGCNDPNKPFLVRYDQIGRKVCVSEGDLLTLRLQPSNCNTRVTLGDKIDGGCSQYNFFNRQGVSLSRFSNKDLKAEDVVAVPMHRNVAYYHQNSGNSPLIKTQLYYTSTKFLPCEMHSDNNPVTVQTADTKVGQKGYCDVDQIVKDKLCWTGVGANADTTQKELIDGSHFYTPDQCDVIQHVPQYQTEWKTPINNPDPKVINSRVTKNEKTVKDEVFNQGCTKSGVITLQDLENASYYTGDDGRISGSDDYWASLSSPNKCSLSSSSCIDTNGEECTSDSNECSVYNVDQYTSVGLEKCFRKYITRTWEDTTDWQKRIMKVSYARKNDYTNWETYFKITPKQNNMNGDNACKESQTPQDCVKSCYQRCKAMKFPGFSFNPNQIDEKSCKCSDYTMDTCPEGQKVTDTSRTSYTISPLCEDDKCNEKTRYSNKLRPCQFSEDYRKRKCVETCAAENALFMTISAGGLCLCSVAKRADNNKIVDLKGGDVCPWSDATRVYKNRNTEGIQRGKGYLGDSFVTTTPIETYQLVYNTYYGEEEDLRDGVLVCEAGGSPAEEIDDWYLKLTGASIASISADKLKNLYQKN